MTLLKFLLFVCLLTSILADKLHHCSPSRELVSELEKNYEVYIYDHNYNITYDLKDMVVKIISWQDTIVILDTAKVSFSGNIVSKGGYVGPVSTASFDVKPIYVKRFEKVVNGKKERHCRIRRSDNFDLSLDLLPDTKAVIIQLTEYCVQSLICEQYEAIITNDFIRKETNDFENQTKYDNITDDLNDYDTRTASKRLPLTCSKGFSDSFYNPQDTINTLIDFGLSVIITKFVNNVNGVFDIPTIYQNFSYGPGFLKTTGEVEAADGSFEDIRALSRKRDLVFSNEGFRFSVGTTYRLAKAKLQFGSYRVRFGILKINGHLSVDIDGIAISTKVAFDFNSKPCRAELINLEVDEMGKIDVDFTGLGFMNKPMQKLIRWLIEKKTFDSVRDIVAQKLGELECEQYRPSIDLA